MKRSLALLVLVVCMTNPVEAKQHRRPFIAVEGMLPHPSGCPARAFCGCGAAMEVFGRPMRSLWAAASWFHFPSAAPGYNMAAVTQHHVVILKQHIAGSVWLVYDANGGGHTTRYHAKSIAGYRIVNPGGGNYVSS